MQITLQIDGQPVELESLSQRAGVVTFVYEGVTYRFRASYRPDGTAVLEQVISDDMYRCMPVVISLAGKDAMRVQIKGLEAKISRQQTAISGAAGATSALSPTAPMPGLVRQILVKVGDAVTAGQPLVVMEAMKLQQTLTAGGDAVVEKLLVAVGDMVPEGTELVVLKA